MQAQSEPISLSSYQRKQKRNPGVNSPLARIEEHRPAPVQTWTPTFAISTVEMVARTEAKRSFFDQVMRKDEHYGLPPGMEKKPDGTPAKPALTKSGAELLLSSMGLFAELFDAEPPIRDYDGSTHGGEALIAYRRVCRIYRQTGPQENDRVRVVQAEGFCSSRETKYRYREGSRKCPTCGAAAIIKGKKDYGGGWICFSKKGGCGDKFEDDDSSIMSQQLGRIANPDIADQENTILKMADKRAFVAATLLATGCSDIFTQDIDESAPHGDDAPRETKNDTQGNRNQRQVGNGNSGRSNGNEEKIKSAHAEIKKIIEEKSIPSSVIDGVWEDVIGEGVAAFPSWEDGPLPALQGFYKTLKSWSPPQRQEQKPAENPENEKPPAQEPSAIIDPKIINDLRGMIPLPDVNVLCVVAAEKGMTGVALRDIVKRATGGGEMTRPFYDKILATLEQLPKKS